MNEWSWVASLVGVLLMFDCWLLWFGLLFYCVFVYVLWRVGCVVVICFAIVVAADCWVV